jgi:hypothetical protein
MWMSPSSKTGLLVALVIGCAAVVTIAWYRNAAVQSRYGASGWDEDEATERGADGMPLSMYAG